MRHASGCLKNNENKPWEQTIAVKNCRRALLEEASGLLDQDLSNRQDNRAHSLDPKRKRLHATSRDINQPRKSRNTGNKIPARDGTNNGYCAYDNDIGDGDGEGDEGDDDMNQGTSWWSNITGKS